jgi:hypothetical protein
MEGKSSFPSLRSELKVENDLVATRRTIQLDTDFRRYDNGEKTVTVCHTGESRYPRQSNFTNIK